jgi:subtilase family serine protease
MSVLYAKPAWQAGPGVPADNARDVPGVSLSAASHDAYYMNYLGANISVYGTSASAPSMAGIPGDHRSAMRQCYATVHQRAGDVHAGRRAGNR